MQLLYAISHILISAYYYRMLVGAMSYSINRANWRQNKQMKPLQCQHWTKRMRTKNWVHEKAFGSKCNKVKPISLWAGKCVFGGLWLLNHGLLSTEVIAVLISIQIQLWNPLQWKLLQWTKNCYYQMGCNLSTNNCHQYSVVPWIVQNGCFAVCLSFFYNPWCLG